MTISAPAGEINQPLRRCTTHASGNCGIPVLCTAANSHTVIVRVRVSLKRTAVLDCRFDNLSGSHPQNQVNIVCQSMMFRLTTLTRTITIDTPGFKPFTIVQQVIMKISRLICM